MSDNEIEIKLRYDDRLKVTHLLESIGAKPQDCSTLKDIYFSFDGETMSNTNKLIRIREKNTKTELTFKGNCISENNIWERIELNVGIANAEVMEAILLAAGAKKIKKNISKREPWLYNNVEILFIDFVEPNKLSLIEIEGATRPEIEKVLTLLGDLVERAGEELFSSFDKGNE